MLRVPLPSDCTAAYLDGRDSILLLLRINLRNIEYRLRTRFDRTSKSHSLNFSLQGVLELVL